ncbi:hypothetical protein ANO11243_069270 [Dothideomycetidae sp. 11243]|nr:hypothetical protein ANO11243_069270 [fungal sp. No.11243]
MPTHVRPYAADHAVTLGPDDTRPTAMKIVRDLGFNTDKSSSNRVYIVTGATSVIGRETARALAATGATIVLCARDVSAAEAISATFNGNSQTKAVHLDLSNLASVRSAADEILARYSRVDGVVCNAGVMMEPEATTMDGHELHFQVNYLGHWLLLHLLRRALLNAASITNDARVVLVSSAGHRYSPVLFDTHFAVSPYNAQIAYGQSKTALVHLAAEMEARFGGDAGCLHAYAVHPGGVTNGMMDRLDPQVVAAMIAAYGSRMKSPAQGAATSVWALLAPDAERLGGRYLEDCGTSEPVAAGFDDLTPGYALWAEDGAAAKTLWADTVELLGVADV